MRCAAEAEADDKEAALVEMCQHFSFEVAEISSEQTAAHRSVVDVLEGFGMLFGPPQPTAYVAQTAAASQEGHDGRQAPAPSQFWELLASVRQRAAADQLLGDLPLQAMRCLLARVQPRHLQLDAEAQLRGMDASAPQGGSVAAQDMAAAAATAQAAAAASADEGGGSDSSAAVDAALEAHRRQRAAARDSLPYFPLLSPKACALVGHLTAYRSAATNSEVGSADEACWCGIIFVEQRMAAWVLHQLLR